MNADCSCVSTLSSPHARLHLRVCNVCIPSYSRSSDGQLDRLDTLPSILYYSFIANSCWIVTQLEFQIKLFGTIFIFLENNNTHEVSPKFNPTSISHSAPPPQILQSPVSITVNLTPAGAAGECRQQCSECRWQATPLRHCHCSLPVIYVNEFSSGSFFPNLKNLSKNHDKLTKKVLF